MRRVVLRQLAIAAVIAVISVIIGGKPAGVSSILAALCFIVPNAIFVLFFYLGIRGTGPANLVLFAVIEFAKIALTIGCVCLVFLAYKDINWIAFTISFVISFKSYIFLLSKLKS